VGLLGATTTTFTGCGGSKDTPQPTAENTPNNTKSPVQPTQTTAGMTDPTFKPQVIESTDSAPQQTVAVFLDSLRRGDETTANSMLTTIARAEVLKTDYAIQPPGTPEGEFKIGRLGFPYEDQTVALVESQWREPATKTDPELMMDIVCEVHLEGTDWRIAGMALTVAGESEPLVIDFEDGQRLQQQIRIANGQGTAAQSAAQLQQPGQTTTVPGLPASFSLPNSNQPVPAQFGQQQPQGGVQQSGNQQPNLNLNNLPPLPTFPGDSGTQVATPPGGNILR
jgi:hypothetical protein